MKKILIVSILAVISINSAMAYRVLSRTVEKCSTPNFFGKEQCSYTQKILSSFTTPGGDIITGWSIDCHGAGSSSCPKHMPIGDLPDANDVTWSNFLFDYYDGQIAQSNNSGSHTVTVLLPNGDYTYYTITWEYIDNNGEISGFINIDRV
jgi:hypothetical protein